MIGFMPMMIGNPAPSDIPDHVQQRVNAKRDWKITLKGQEPPLLRDGLPHPTFDDYDSALVYCQLLEAEYTEIARG